MNRTPSDDEVKFAAEMMLANAESEACDDENSDETRLTARCDGIIAGFYLRHHDRLTRVTAERDRLRAACETLFAYDRETSPPAEQELLTQAIVQARSALKLCEVQQ